MFLTIRPYQIMDLKVSAHYPHFIYLYIIHQDIGKWVLLHSFYM